MLTEVHSIHYLDKYDLLDQMENEKIDEIRSFIKGNTHFDNETFSENQLRETMEFVISSIGKHLEFYKLMFNIEKTLICMRNYMNY